jgi:hypothetical protein
MTDRAPLPIRGVHIDCRAQMLRFERLRRVYEDLAACGFNTVLFEYEDRFPYRGDLRDISAPDALTRPQIRELNRLAADVGLQIMPMVQCLGHLEYVLRLPKLARLVEPYRKTGGVPYAVCPSRRNATGLFREMAEQVLDLHPGIRRFHLGGDEVRLARDCTRCGPRIAADGVSRVLIDHYAACAEWLRDQGPDPVIWCDMVLAHPEHLGDLRGRVTIMDWDYWSLRQRPRGPARWHPHFWGLGHCDWRHPETWPATHRRLYANYLLDEQGRPNPFPYTPFLRDQGFQVIVAPAARCAGDSFCTPMIRHRENIAEAVRAATRHNTLGFVITNWALRRAPWPLTEPAIRDGIRVAQQPQISRRELNRWFALDNFGVNDPKLAQVASLLGVTAGPNAFLVSMPEIDVPSGRRAGPGRETRFHELRKAPQERRKEFVTLRRTVRRARKLLAAARPTTPRQREQVALWHWAADVLEHNAEFGLLVLDNTPPEDPRMQACRRRTGALRERTEELLRPIYTDRTLADELACRFDWQFTA